MTQCEIKIKTESGDRIFQSYNDLLLYLESSDASFLWNRYFGSNRSEVSTPFIRYRRIDAIDEMDSAIKPKLRTDKVKQWHTQADTKLHPVLSDTANPDVEAEADVDFIENGIGVRSMLELPYADITGRRRCIKGSKILTDDEFKQYLKKTCPIVGQETAYVGRMLKLNAWKMDFGTHVHNVIEAIINNSKIPTAPEFLNVSDDLQNSIIDQAKAFKKQLIEKHGKNAEFITEKIVMAKRVSSSMTKLASDVLNKKVDTLYGKIDLLVFDENDNAFIYDFKVSEKDISSWSSWKKNDGALQVLTYARILNQWGISVADANCFLVPIAIDLNKDENNISTEKVNTVTFADHVIDAYSARRKSDDTPMMKWRSWIPTANRVSANDLENSTMKLVRSILPAELLNVDLADVQTGDQTTVEAILHNKDFVMPIRPSSESGKEGFKYKLLLKGTKIDPDEFSEFSNKIQSSEVYLTEENARDAIAKFAAMYDQAQKEEFSEFGKKIQSMCDSRSKSEFQIFLDGYTEKKASWLRYTLYPYINNNWNLISDDALLDNGIFVFEKGDGANKVYDVIMMDNHNLSRTFDFKNGALKLNLAGQHATTVAGAFFTDDEIDNKKVLSATYGNLLLMKAMAYITNNSHVFNGKIRSVKAMSVKNRQMTQASNTLLQSSWEKIMLGANQVGTPEFTEDRKPEIEGIGNDRHIKRNRFNIKGISDDHFVNDALAYLDIGKEILQITEDSSLLLRKIEEIDNPIRQLDELIEKLSKRYTDNTGFVRPIDIFVDPNERDVALQYLYRGKLALYKKFLMWEKDINTWMAEITAPAMASTSANTRIANDLMGVYGDRVGRDFVQSSNKWRKLLQDAYKETGASNIKDEAAWFRDRFFADSKNLILYDLETFAKMYSTNSAMYKLMECFQQTLIDLTSNGNDEVYIDGTVVPLVKGTRLDRMIHENPLYATIDGWKELWGLIKDPVISDDELPDMYAHVSDDEIRKHHLESHYTGYYTTNLDIIFNRTLLQQTRKKWQREMSPVFAAIGSTLAYMNCFEAGDFDSNKMKSLQKWMNDYIDAKFQNKLLMDPNETKIYTLVNKLTGLTSTVQLALNTRAMMREVFTSLFIGESRAFVELFPGITTEIYNKALERVIGGDDKADLDGMLHQQNAYFRMANMDISGLADEFKSDRYNPFNFNKKIAFMTSSIGDLYFRNTLLQAMLIADKTDQAYGIWDGKYGYNFAKDPRFEILKTKGEGLNRKQLLEYSYAIELYNRLADDINTRLEMFQDPDMPLITSFEHIKFGQEEIRPLFDGYTESEIQGIRNYADFLYGHYNDENKMMLQERFFGHFLMQYRTFLSSRVEQNINAPGATNIVRYRRVKDKETGEDLYIATIDGIPRFLRESEVTEEMIRNGEAKLYEELVGLNMEGTLRAMAAGAVALSKWKDDPELWKTYWAKPANRALLTIFIMDNFVTMLLMLLLNTAFGEEKKDTKLHKMKDSDWFKRWSYGVIAGSLQDGPIWNLVGQMNSLNPPVIDQLSNWYNNTVNVITGNDNFAHVAIESFGMTRELSHYFDLNK